MDFQAQIQFLKWRWAVVTLAIPDAERTSVLFILEQKILCRCDRVLSRTCVAQYYIPYITYSISSLHGYTVIITRKILGSLYKLFGEKKAQMPKMPSKCPAIVSMKH